MAYLNYFPREVIELNKEVGAHPKLAEELEKLNSTDFLIRLARVAAYCGVVLDDIYTAEDINKICVICTERLRRQRTGIISDIRH